MIGQIIGSLGGLAKSYIDAKKSRQNHLRVNDQWLYSVQIILFSEMGWNTAVNNCLLWFSGGSMLPERAVE